jgi:spore coat protein A
VHLHGGVQPPESDGYPTDLIPSGGSKDYVYPNLHRAATLFYHDHAMNHTGEHVYRGLSSLYFLQDEIEQGLPLPKGEFDVPIVIQDRSFNRDGSFAFNQANPTNTFGQEGDAILINGVPWPRMQVAARRYRFRLLNGSASTAYELALSSGDQLVQIATDGGLLDRPVVAPGITLSPAERTEVVVDFSGRALGTTVDLLNRLGAGDTAALLRFEVVRRADEDSQVPKILAATERPRGRSDSDPRLFVPTGDPCGVAAFPVDDQRARL